MSSIGPPGSPGPAGFPSRGFFEQWFSQSRESHDIAVRTANLGMQGYTPTTVQGDRNELLYNPPPLEVMLQAAVTLGEKTSEGHVIEAVSIPWLAFLEHIKRNPDGVHEIHWRKWEEIIAGAYSDAGYDVTLTPRSGDGGRDVIASTKDGALSLRYFDQVKAYKPGQLVLLDDVSSMLGVLSRYDNVSKGIITTTSGFAPGVFSDEGVNKFRPYRLDLRAKDDLLTWLGQVASRARK